MTIEQAMKPFGYEGWGDRVRELCIAASRRFRSVQMDGRFNLANLESAMVLDLYGDHSRHIDHALLITMLQGRKDIACLDHVSQQYWCVLMLEAPKETIDVGTAKEKQQSQRRYDNLKAELSDMRCRYRTLRSLVAGLIREKR